MARVRRAAAAICFACGIGSDEWRVTAPSPQAGERFTIRSSVDHRLAYEVRVDGNVLRQSEQTIHDEATWTIELAGDAAERTATVEYGDCARRVTSAAIEEDGNGACHQREFVITRDAGADAGRVRLVAEPGQEPGAARVVHDPPALISAPLARRVLADARETLLGGRLAALLARSPLVEGQALDVPLDLGLELLQDPLGDPLRDPLAEPARGATLTRFTLVPTAARTEDGVETISCRATITATLPPKQDDRLAVTTTIELAGELLFARADGRLMAATLEGPLSSRGTTTASERIVEVAGTGTLVWAYRARPIAR